MSEDANITLADLERVLGRKVGSVLFEETLRQAENARSDDAPTLAGALDEIELLVDEYDRAQSDWGFRRSVIKELIDKARILLPKEDA